jgi:hypothetical protein
MDIPALSPRLRLSLPVLLVPIWPVLSLALSPSAVSPFHSRFDAVLKRLLWLVAKETLHKTLRLIPAFRSSEESSHFFNWLLDLVRSFFIVYCLGVNNYRQYTIQVPRSSWPASTR